MTIECEKFHVTNPQNSDKGFVGWHGRYAEPQMPTNSAGCHV